MKTIGNIGATFLISIAAAGIAIAQDTKAPITTPVSDTKTAADKPPVENRNEMLKQLGLNREQMQAIRRINADRKPLMDEAQNRSKEATKALDEAIYSDTATDADVQARLQTAQKAQADVMRIRFINELAVRRLLTPEQLVKFRDLRLRFEKAKEEYNLRNQPQRPAASAGVPARSTVQQPIRKMIRQSLKRTAP